MPEVFTKSRSQNRRSTALNEVQRDSVSWTSDADSACLIVSYSPSESDMARAVRTTLAARSGIMASLSRTEGLETLIEATV